jgi:hypothetical protein
VAVAAVPVVVAELLPEEPPQCPVHHRQLAEPQQRLPDKAAEARVLPPQVAPEREVRPPSMSPAIGFRLWMRTTSSGCSPILHVPVYRAVVAAALQAVRAHLAEVLRAAAVVAVAEAADSRLRPAQQILAALTGPEAVCACPDDCTSRGRTTIR